MDLPILLKNFLNKSEYFLLVKSSGIGSVARTLPFIQQARRGPNAK